VVPQVQIWMYFSSLFLNVPINISMVTIISMILSLMCSRFHILFLSPFPPLLPLRIFSVLFFLEPLRYPFLWLIFSRYCTYTHASSMVLGLKSITLLCRWLCRLPKHLRIKSRLLGEIPNMMAIFLNLVVYSCTLCP
jgi:hypothetical protein